MELVSRGLKPWIHVEAKYGWALICTCLFLVAAAVIPFPQPQQQEELTEYNVPSVGYYPYTVLTTATPNPTEQPIHQNKTNQENQTMSIHIGPSSYPRTNEGNYSTDIIDDIIEYMDTHGCNVYRMSIYYTVSSETRNAMIRYFLENCNYDLIVCRHVYDPGGSLSSSDWSNILNWTLEVCQNFSAYADRVWVEFVNECGDSDLGSRCQTLVTAVRNAGYTNKLVANKWTQSWSSMAITDTLDEFYSGMHFYFNSWSVSGAQTQMNYARSAGVKVINTEIGADSNEENQFSSGEVAEVNQFLAWCSDSETRVVGNCVWMRYGLQNADTYTSLGLVWPTVEEPPDPEVSYVITAEAGANGSISPSGEVEVDEGDNQTFTWTPDEGYVLDALTVDGDAVEASGSYTFLNVTAVHTITVSFTEAPVGEADDTVQVAASADDCTVDGSFMQALTNNWVGMGRSGDGLNDRNSGIRFLALAVPAGATVTSAKLTGKSYAAYSNTLNLKIKGEKSLTPATFSTAANFNGRTRTTAAVDWDISADWALGETVESADFAAVIQEIIDQEGWSSGGDIVIFIENDGTSGSTRRNVRAYDYSGNADGLTLTVEASVEAEGGAIAVVSVVRLMLYGG